MNTDSLILVVDDEPLILSATARLLKQAGYQVIEAQTGEQALQSAQEHSPDLVLLDNVLPDIDGLEICRRLKADKKTANIYICIASGLKITSKDQSEGLEIGADEYLIRPIENRELLARVNAMLRLRNSEKELKLYKNHLESLVKERTQELQAEIVGRKQADKALLQSKVFSNSVLNSLSAHIAVLNDQGTIVAVNEAWREFAQKNSCNRAANVCEGASYFDVCRKAIELNKDDDAAAALKGITEVMRGSNPYFSLEYPCHSPDEQRFFNMKVLPLEGMETSVVVAHENITRIKSAEMSLQKRSQELAMLNKVSTQVSQSLSIKQVTSNALEGLLKATEASTAFLLIRKGEDLVPAGMAFSDPSRKFDEFPTHRIGECLCGRSVVEERAMYSADINRDERCTWEECKQAGLHSAAALPLYRGKEIFAVMGLGKDTVHDFEAQSEYLETLASAIALGLQNAELFDQTQQHAQHLETEVRKRTRELEESQMALIKSLEEIKTSKREIESANYRLQELDRLKSMFIASMSHELRTPLNSIIGFTGILLQGLAGDLNEEQKDQLGRVSRAGNHLLALITDVIDVSKIEAGKVDIYTEQFGLGELIDEAIATIRTDVEAKGLSLKTQISEAILMETDRRRLLQCVMNLVSNAVKYSERGIISVVVKKEDKKVRILVSDNGIGISESDQKLLFTSFSRFESHLKTRTPGTGLGLYLTKKIVTELLGGNISAKSQLAEGSSFEITLPLNSLNR